MRPQGYEGPGRVRQTPWWMSFCSGPAQRCGREQQVLLPYALEVDRGLGPGTFALGGDHDATAPVVVHHLVADGEPEVFGAGAAPGGTVAGGRLERDRGGEGGAAHVV